MCFLGAMVASSPTKISIQDAEESGYTCGDRVKELMQAYKNCKAQKEGKYTN